MFFFGVAEEAHSFHPHWSPYQRDNLTAPFGFSSHHAFSFFMVWEFFKFLNFVSILMKEKFIFKPLVLSYFAVASKRKQAKKSSMHFLESFSQASDHIAHKFYNSQTPGHKHNAAMFSVTAKHQ